MKRYQCGTHTSKAKTKPPVLLDDRLATMWKNIEELQDTLAQEITVTDSLGQTQQKTLESHSKQILALKSAVEGLSKSILGSMDELYTDVKAFAGRELAVLCPKIEGLNEQFVNVESATRRNAIDMNSLRRELNDRYEFIIVKVDGLSSDLREVKDKQALQKEEISQLRDELKRQEEKNKDYFLGTTEKIKEITENVERNWENLNQIEKKYEKVTSGLQSDSKKQSETFVKKLKEYDETCQTQMIALRSSILENNKEVASLSQFLEANKEKIAETRSDLTQKIEDLWENFGMQVKKLTSTSVELEGKVENHWEKFQEGLDEVSKSFIIRLESLSRTLIGDNKTLLERINKSERDFDSFQRDLRNSITGIERSLLIHDEKISFLSRINQLNSI